MLEDAGEPIAPKEVAELLDKNPNAVKYLMWRMSKDIQLDTAGKGRYSSTTDPANPLTEEGDGRSVSEVGGDTDIASNERREFDE